MKKLATAIVLVGISLAPLYALGRHPDKEEGFPDYNRLELRKKVPETPPDKPAPSPVKPPPLKSSDLPKPLPPQDDKPQPPPKVVPLPDGSEPAMPDDMLNTLIPGQSTSTPSSPTK